MPSVEACSIIWSGVQNRDLIIPRCHLQVRRKSWIQICFGLFSRDSVQSHCKKHFLSTEWPEESSKCILQTVSQVYPALPPILTNGTNTSYFLQRKKHFDVLFVKYPHAEQKNVSLRRTKV